MVTKLSRHDMLIFHFWLSDIVRFPQALHMTWAELLFFGLSLSLSLGVCAAFTFSAPCSELHHVDSGRGNKTAGTPCEAWAVKLWKLALLEPVSIGKHGWKYAPNCSDLLTTGCTCYQANRKELQELQDKKHCPLWVGPASFEQFQSVICIIILGATAHAHMYIWDHV